MAKVVLQAFQITAATSKSECFIHPLIAARETNARLPPLSTHWLAEGPSQACKLVIFFSDATGTPILA